MKKICAILFAALFAGQAWAEDQYDFTAVCESGQMLWYKIIDGGVSVVSPYDYYNTSLYGNSGRGDVRGDLIIPESVTHDDNTYTVTRIGGWAFLHCIYLKSVTIPNTVTIIDSIAFFNTGLTSIVIPKSVTSIGARAFAYTGLTSVTIPESVTSIGARAFAYTGLTSVTIPNSVTSIGLGAFSDCYFLESITLPFVGDKPHEPTETYQYPFGYIFGNNNHSNSHLYIATQYYYGNSIHNPTSSEYRIPKSLSSVTITGGGYIPYGAFYNCNSLTSVTIFNSVTSISDYAFFGCFGLTSVTIPSSVVKIGTNAFNDCRNLTSIAYDGTSAPTIGTNAFKNVNSSVVVCVSNDYSSSSFGGLRIHKGLVHDNAVEPTCTGTGLTEGLHCTRCRKVIVEQGVIPSLGHNYSNTITAPTCTDVGFTTHTCSVCEYTYNSDTVAAKGHTYNNTVTEPTCTGVGYTTHTCSVCEYTYNSDTIAANGHTADNFVFENQEPATCTTIGSYDSAVYCSVCQAELFREEKEEAAFGHTYSTNITAPTCTAVGYTTHTCSVCEYTYNSDTIAASGHTEVVDAAIAATCTVAGKTEGKHCSVCNETLVAQQEVAAIGHTEVIDAAIAATCTAVGKTEGRHCSVCNEVIEAQTEIAALGHDFGEYVYNNDATTDADGTETSTCERGCGATDTRVAEGTKLLEPEKGTAVSEVASTLNIYAHGNIIVIENATNEISVYNAMGILICRDAIHRVRAEINVSAPGIYIVKVGGTAKRVMVN